MGNLLPAPRAHEPAPADRVQHFVVIGDNGVGKTSLILRHSTNEFPQDVVPAVTDNVNVMVENISCGIWDTHARGESDRLRPLAYPGTDFFLLCFALDDEKSLVNVREKWFPEVEAHSPRSMKYLVGLKKDLIPDSQIQRRRNRRGKKCETVSMSGPLGEQADELKRELGMMRYFECSAMTGEGVCELFWPIACGCRRHRRPTR